MEPGPDVPDLTAMRRDYARVGLREQDLPTDPATLFTRWLGEVAAAGLAEPNAMVLATAGADGVPSARTVLFKGQEDGGFAFYTNLGSPKARELEANPRAALVFPWHALHRQVRVAGPVRPLPRARVAAYFATRPRGARLGAWASNQSQVVAGREALDRGFDEMAARWPDGTPVPLPDFWGGFAVVPETVEFWAGRENRLHDRFRYRRDGTGWVVERLAP
ncbi:MAG: pyridoxamine 5'-phosphate oxidase [Actinomycetes bacterium]